MNNIFFIFYRNNSKLRFAKVVYLGDETELTVPIDYIKEFKKKLPAQSDDFNKKGVYSVWFTDPSEKKNDKYLDAKIKVLLGISFFYA